MRKSICFRIMEKFRGSRDRYRRLGVPYHRGYLLYGPPGTGKTSLVSALGAKYGMSIYVVNLADFSDRYVEICYERCSREFSASL